MGEKMLFLILFFVLFAILAFLDKRFNLRLMQEPLTKGTDDLDALKKRVITLEKVATDPGERLKREIDAL